MNEWGRIVGGPVVREGFIPGRYPPRTYAEAEGSEQASAGPGLECEEADACTMDPACPLYLRCGRRCEHEE